MKPIKGSEVFWNSAIDLFEKKSRFVEGCCFTMSNYTKLYMSEQRDMFRYFFDDNNGVYWMESPEHTNEQDREHRVWAMLFMEQIWKDELWAVS